MKSLLDQHHTDPERPPRRWFRLSVAGVLTISMTLIVALLMAFTTYLDIRRERAIFHQELQERGLLLASTLDNLLADYIYSQDITALDEIAAIFSSQPGIEYFEIYTPDGRLLVASFSAEVPTPVAGPLLSPAGAGQPAFRYDRGTLNITSEVSAGSEVVALVRFGFSTASLSSKEREIALEHLEQASIVIIVGIGLAFVISRYFVRPVQRLARATEKLARGDLDIDLSRDERRNDEIGDLAFAFGQMARALGNSRRQLEYMLKAEQEKAVQLQALKDVAELGLSDRPRDELLQLLLERIVWAHQADGGSIFLYNEASGMLERLAVTGVASHSFTPTPFQPDEGVVGKVMAEGMPVVVDDVPNSPLVLNQAFKELGVQTMVSIPLKLADRAIGTVSLHYTSPHYIGQHQLSMVELMAERVAQVIERARLLELERQRTLELARANEENLAMMKELQLAQARNIQAAKMAAVGQLAAGIAHEINNPLSSIMGFTQLGQQRLLAKSSKQLEAADIANLERYLRYIDSEARRCGQIVSKLLSFVRVPRDQMEPTDLNTLVEHSLDLTSNQMRLAGTRLRKELAPNLPLVNANATNMVQVFTNIIINATKAMPGGGELTVISRPAVPGSGGKPTMVEVHFSDTGVGIPKENMAKLFEPFFTTSEPGSGTGLGLYVCYQVVQQHNGEIEVESEPGKGSTFIVRLPVALDQKATKSDGKPGEASARV